MDQQLLNMEAGGPSNDIDESKTKKPGAVHIFMEYVLPINLVLLTVFLLILFFWIGPVAVLKFILSFIPKNPGMWHALILFAVIVAAIVVPTPFWPPLMIVTAMVFGFWKGFLIIYCAMVLSAVISFWLGRLFLMKPFREYMESSDYLRVRRMIRVAEAEGNSFKFTFLFRFLGLPIWIRNYVPPMLHILFWHFFVSVLCHSLMICLIFASTGTATKDIVDVIADGQNPWENMKPKQMITFAVSLIATVTLSYLAYSEYAKKMAEEDVREETQALLSDQP